MLAIGIGLLVPLLLLEAGLRFLPVNEGLRTQPVNALDPVLHFEARRTSTFSRGWNFSIVNTVRTNNHGFVNDQDYDPADRRPLIALVGDSYVEAVMVPWAETAAGRLAAHFGDTARVYSFGASGSALSQYLAYARHVRDTYAPSVLVILVVGNDFDESLLKYKDWPGQTFFAENADGELELVRRDYSPSLPRRLVQHSALGMYLVTNVGLNSLQQLWQTWRKPAQGAWVGNTAAGATAERVRDSQAVVQAFLAQLPAAAGLAPSRIVIAVEANRQAIYDEAAAEALAGSYFGQLRQYLITGATAGGFAVIDLHPVFEAHWRAHHQRFEWPEDWHWNGRGHGVFAAALRQKLEAVEPAFAQHPGSGVKPHPHAADTR